jgi:non-ribosomal peptide synthetase component F
VEGRRAVTYRELNYRANACARFLISHGCRRGSHVVVRMPRGADLAVVLLAVLKAGGSYTWVDSGQDSGAPAIELPTGSIGLDSISTCVAQPSPNLPILTRASDIACVLQGAEGAAEVLVPHATLVALRRASAAASIEWTGDPGALDLWLALMSGATATIEAQPAIVAA